MDNILEEIGAKWEYLGKSEQVALAQAVAGIRQYNQLVALMDNFEKVTSYLANAIVKEGGDPMRETLNVIKTLDGIEKGTITPEKQDDSKATHAEKITNEELTKYNELCAAMGGQLTYKMPYANIILNPTKNFDNSSVRLLSSNLIALSKLSTT